ncbi:MAG: ferredoxin-like protein [Chloroflexi bacterium]|nr:ferredoxin-like protein [Chloroflexota bacterium]
MTSVRCPQHDSAEIRYNRLGLIRSVKVFAMHHALKLYSRYQQSVLRYYIFQAKWARLPLVGKVVRRVANLYGKKAHGAYLLTHDEANEIVDIAEGLALGPCACRTVFPNCDSPISAEIMVGPSRNIFLDEKAHDYREITKQEARDILRQCHQSGLIHTIVKCRQGFYAICNCCACCCVPLRLNRQYGIGKAFSRDNGIVQQFKEQLQGGARPPIPLR